MGASAPSISDIKMLFARSGNRCAFPKCRAPMAVNQTLTGEVCQVHGPGVRGMTPAKLAWSVIPTTILF